MISFSSVTLALAQENALAEKFPNGLKYPQGSEEVQELPTGTKNITIREEV